MQSREIRLKSRPQGLPVLDNFEFATIDVAPPGPGEVQVKNLFMSVDPYMRGRMIDRKSYLPPFKLGESMEGGAVGEVTASNAEGFKSGDLVLNKLGWREAFTAQPATAALKVIETHGLPPQAFLGVAGVPGLTAYAGLLKVAAMKEGDTVFVSAAAGAVGQVVCQIAKIKRATVIGSAGGTEKCAFLKEIGVDYVIDYKRERDLTKALAAAAPEGIDVYFENVGGAHLEAALEAAKPLARFAVCGMISNYNDLAPAPGPSNLFLIGAKSLRIEGFNNARYRDLMPSFVSEVAGWIQSGKLITRETVDEGIANAPSAFLKLFNGGNIGKMLVKL